MLKVLLVDDERTILDGLEYLLSKCTLDYRIVGKVESGVEALQIVQKREVDLILTDIRMPKMDGIEMTRLIKKDYPNIFIVALSAYSDFDYVRRIMQCGAHDYLLKPCKKDDLLKVIEGVSYTVLRRQDILNRKSKHNQIKEYLLGKVELDHDIGFPQTSYFVAFKANSIQNSMNQFKAWLEKKLNGIQVMELSLRDIQVFLCSQNISLALCNEFLNTYGNPPIFCVIKAVSTDADHLEKGFRVCQRLLEFAEFNHIHYTVDDVIYEKLAVDQPDFRDGKYSLKEDFKNYFLLGNQERLEHAIYAKVSEMKACCLYFDPVKIKKDLFAQLLAIDYLMGEQWNIGLEQAIGKEMDFIYELDRLRNHESLFNWFRNVCLAAAQHQELVVTPPEYIRTALTYLERHYMFAVDLKVVAEHVYLNEWYFSTQFKRFLGISFSEYLNQVRIRAAKLLLENKKLKISQVAQKVGFNDQAYFSMVFKRLENQTPKQYQNNAKLH